MNTTKSVPILGALNPANIDEIAIFSDNMYDSFLKERQSTINQEIVSYKDGISEIQSKITGLINNINSLQSNVQIDSNNINTLQSDVQINSNNIDILTSNINTLTSNIDALEYSIQSINQSISDLQKQQSSPNPISPVKRDLEPLTDNPIANAVIKKLIINPRYDNHHRDWNIDDIYISTFYNGNSTYGLALKWKSNSSSVIYITPTSSQLPAILVDNYLTYETETNGVYIYIEMDYNEFPAGQANIRNINFLNKDIFKRIDWYDISDIKKQMINAAKRSLTTLRQTKKSNGITTTVDDDTISLGEKWNYEQETKYSNILGRVFNYLDDLNNRRDVYHVYPSPNSDVSDIEIVKIEEPDFNYEIPTSLNECSRITTNYTTGQITVSDTTISDYDLPTEDYQIIYINDQEEFDDLPTLIPEALQSGNVIVKIADGYYNAPSNNSSGQFLSLSGNYGNNNLTISGNNVKILVGGNNIYSAPDNIQGDYWAVNHESFFESGSQYSSFFTRDDEDSFFKLNDTSKFRPIIRQHVYTERNNDINNSVKSQGKNIYIEEFQTGYFQFKAYKRDINKLHTSTENPACVCIASGWSIFIFKLYKMIDNGDGTVTIQFNGAKRTGDRKSLSLGDIDKPYSYGIRFKILNDTLSQSFVYIDDGKMYIPSKYSYIVECTSNTFLNLNKCTLGKLTLTGLTFTGGRIPLHLNSTGTSIVNANRNGILNIGGGNAIKVSIDSCNFYDCHNYCITTVYHPTQNNIQIKNCHFKNNYLQQIYIERHAIGVEITNNIFENSKIDLGQSCCVYCKGIKTYIADNKFINSPYISIRLGNWSDSAPECYEFNPSGNGTTAIVERNEMYWTPEFRNETIQNSIYDGGQIYTGSQVSRIQIRHNHIHDIGGLDDHYCGIYLDAGTENVDIYGNMIIDVAGISIYAAYRYNKIDVLGINGYSQYSTISNTRSPRNVLMYMTQCSGGSCIGNIVNSPIYYQGHSEHVPSGGEYSSDYKTWLKSGQTSYPNAYVNIPKILEIPSNIEGGNILLYTDLEVETKTDNATNSIIINNTEFPLYDLKIQCQKIDNGNIYILRSLRDQLVYRLPWDMFISQHIHSAVSSSAFD